MIFRRPFPLMGGKISSHTNALLWVFPQVVEFTCRADCAIDASPVERDLLMPRQMPQPWVARWLGWCSSYDMLRGTEQNSCFVQRKKIFLSEGKRGYPGLGYVASGNGILHQATMGWTARLCIQYRGTTTQAPRSIRQPQPDRLAVGRQFPFFSHRARI